MRRTIPNLTGPEVTAYNFKTTLDISANAQLVSVLLANCEFGLVRDVSLADLLTNLQVFRSLFLVGLTKPSMYGSQYAGETYKVGVNCYSRSFFSASRQTRFHEEVVAFHYHVGCTKDNARILRHGLVVDGFGRHSGSQATSSAKQSYA